MRQTLHALVGGLKLEVDLLGLHPRPVLVVVVDAWAVVLPLGFNQRVIALGGGVKGQPFVGFVLKLRGVFALKRRFLEGQVFESVRGLGDPKDRRRIVVKSTIVTCSSPGSTLTPEASRDPGRS